MDAHVLVCNAIAIERERLCIAGTRMTATRKGGSNRSAKDWENEASCHGA